MGTKFDAEFQASFVDLSDRFGERVWFYNSIDGEPQRSIMAMVYREPGEFLSSAGEVVSYNVAVEVANDTTNGIAMTEVDEGLGYILVALREGETVTIADAPGKLLPIMQVIESDGGVLRIKVQ